MVEKGYGFLSSHGGIEAVESMKKKAAYVHQDYEHGLLTQEKTKEGFTLPDGQNIWYGLEAFYSAEGLFSPGIFGFPTSSMHSTLVHAINKSGDLLCEEISQTVVLVCTTLQQPKR